MKTPINFNSTEEPTAKSPTVKTTKKTTKSRTKSNKSEGNNKSSNGIASNSNNNNGVNSTFNYNSSSNTVVATATVYPSTPKTAMTTGSAYDSPTLGSGAGNNMESGNSSSSRSHHKSYPGLDARSVKIIWEQHDQSDVELSAEVCARVAEDASYKLWEIINSIKTYARHSGGLVSYDLVNEVLRDADVPPTLGAMDSDWERITYDGSYFFFSDKIIELRDEYQNDVRITMPAGPDLVCSWPVEDKNMEPFKKYIPSIMYVSLYGDSKSFDIALNEAATTPQMGACFRVFLAKLLQILAFKQNDSVNLRCWRLLRALAFNPYTRDVDCREQYFNLSEILICQLLAPYETIKVHNVKFEAPKTPHDANSMTLKMETDEMPPHVVKNEFTDEEMFSAEVASELQPTVEKIYKLQPDEDGEENNDVDTMTSAYFASPVDWAHVDALCETIGQLAVANGFFHSECLYNIVRRLERFFDGRTISTERDFNYISRAVRGLISLGEFAFREFTPFIYKFEAANVPENLWNDFAPAARFLNGHDDIFLYEWLEFLCGAEKLQPLLVYYAQYHEKMLTYRFLHRRTSTYKICPKLGVRRLEWSSLAAAMCHGDDPNKALKPKPDINDYFPELTAPNRQLNCAGIIRFKFAGCRPVIIKPKASMGSRAETMSYTTASSLQKDILIARRKLLKPLTNERRVVPLCSYHFAHI